MGAHLDVNTPLDTGSTQYRDDDGYFVCRDRAIYCRGCLICKDACDSESARKNLCGSSAPSPYTNTPSVCNVGYCDPLESGYCASS